VGKSGKIYEILVRNATCGHQGEVTCKRGKIEKMSRHLVLW
jgi:hypothetical protein